MTSLQYYCILGPAEIKTLHPTEKSCAKNAGSAGNTINWVPIWGGGGGGGHSSCNASLSQSNVQKNSRSLVRGMGGLKFEKKNAREQSPYLRKKRAYFPLYFVLFHSPQPNNIGPARQQPTDWGSLNVSESGRRRGEHSYYL